jgi:hypothetical protein
MATVCSIRYNANQVVSMEPVHIPGMVEGTRADFTAVGIVSQSKIQCPNQWVPVLDLFEESAMHGLVTQNVFRCRVGSRCSAKTNDR